MKTLILAAIVSLPLFSPALAQRYDGSWDFTEEGCASPHSDGRLTVEGDVLRFWESSCSLSNPTALPGLSNATLYDATCSGEGNSWTTTFLLSAYGAQGGYLLVLQNDDASIRTACNWPEGGTAAPAK